jgi:hypothetical protein
MTRYKLSRDVNWLGALKKMGTKQTGKTRPWCIFIQNSQQKYKHKDNGLQFLILNANNTPTFLSSVCSRNMLLQELTIYSELNITTIFKIIL